MTLKNELLGDVTRDTDTGAILVTESTGNTHTPITAKAVGAAWDADGDEVEIPAGADSVLLISTTDVFIVINSLTTDPTIDGWFMPKYSPTKLPCRGCTKIHYKRVSADGTLYANVVGE